jgi:serine/threonine-protein kinase
VFETRLLGRYRLRRRIGGGGMGEVWAAFHPGLRRDVALKILTGTRAHDEIAISRFEREVRATAELSHPNIVRVFDYGVTEDGLRYYAMELLDGEDLRSLIRRNGALAPEGAIRLIAQAARALAEAHRRGIVHRDIKPANLFVTSPSSGEMFVKILDFGIAKLLGESVDETLTQTGAFVGTPAYTSPEVAAGGEADPRSDIYSLGAVFYYLLTAQPPFPGSDVRNLLRAQIEQMPVAPSAVCHTPIPADIDNLVMKCLNKDPALRFPSAVELADALARLPLATAPVDGLSIAKGKPRQ